MSHTTKEKFLRKLQKKENGRISKNERVNTLNNEEDLFNAEPVEEENCIVNGAHHAGKDVEEEEEKKYFRIFITITIMTIAFRFFVVIIMMIISW